MRAPEAAIVAALLVGACASPAGIETRATPLDAANVAATRSLAGAPVGEAPGSRWWTAYRDAQLDALMDEALAHHPSLDVARARVAQAQAAADAARVALAPAFDTSASASRQRLSEHGLVPPPFGGAWVWQNQAMLDFRYEFDFWGRNRKAYEAALGRVRATEVDAAAAALVLETALARAYLQLEAAFVQRDLADDAVAQRSRIVDLTRARFDAGLEFEGELRQAEAALADARAQRLAADEAIALARHQVAALAGQGPDRGLALARPTLQAAPPRLPSRLPVDLVGRRPDIVAQRLRIEAAASGIASARAAFYPNIDLTGFVGLQSIDFRHFLDPSSYVAALGPAIRLPLFDRGQLRATLAARSADWDLAVGQYNQAIVDALREVVDQLATLRALGAREGEVTKALHAAERAHAVAVDRYRAGLGNFLTVLVSESAVLAQRSTMAELRLRRLDTGVALIRALGGGYDPAADRTAAH